MPNINLLKKFFIFLILFITPFSKLYATEANNANSFYFLTLSDIHFDPFISCKLQKPCPLIAKLRRLPVNQWTTLLATNDTDDITYHEDSSYTLLKSALTATKYVAEAKQVRFVLILGDFLGHDFKRNYKKYSDDSSNQSYRLFVNKILLFLTNEISNTFPRIDVYSVVGNNDTYQGDYQSTPHGPFFHDTAKLWGSLIKTKTNQSIMENHFPNAGYYAVTIKDIPHLRLIVLNTNLFSYNAKGNQVTVAANEELNWLQSQLILSKEKNQKVFIAMHIPQAIDIYATKRFHLFRLLDFWKPEYTQRFQKNLKDFSSEIKGIFAGHVHLEWFQILTFDNNSDEIVESGTPSISPIYGNNPGFKVYEASFETLQIESYTTHYYPLNKNHIWTRSYDFKKTYEQSIKIFPRGMNSFGMLESRYFNNLIAIL